MVGDDKEIKDLELSMLQLQRSALIDIQTIFQILVEKELCDVNTIIEVQSKVASENEDVLRMNQAIRDRGGQLPVESSVVNNSNIQNQLKELHSLLLQLADSQKQA